MAGILAITTFMAVLFGILRYFNAPAALYVFLGLQALVTCLVQMRYGDVPRLASIAVGAIFLPLCTIVTVAIVARRPSDLLTVLCMTPFLLLVGAGFGYLAGACTAGLFLLMDLIEPHLPGGAGHRPRYARQLPQHGGGKKVPLALKKLGAFLLESDPYPAVSPFAESPSPDALTAEIVPPSEPESEPPFSPEP
jgi:hypothetical protein